MGRIKVKVKVKVKVKPNIKANAATAAIAAIKLPSNQQLDNPKQLLADIGITGLINLCQQHHVIIRGGPDNICQTLKKKLYPNASVKGHKDVIFRTFTRYLFWRLGECQWTDRSSNEEDFYTSVPIHRIPECYRFMCLTHRQIHGFDIRSLVYYREIGNNFRHPYTDRPFTEKELHRMDRKIHWLQRLGYQISHTASKASKASKATNNTVSRQSLEQMTINVFASINEHQYVDYNWFMSLTHYGLVQLYHELHEIWMYRLPMQADHKEHITKYSVFANWTNIRNYQPSMETKIRIELLKNIQHLVEDGTTEDHRKTGCYIFMLGLVLVSEDAATSHPSMYQAAYYQT